MLLTKFRLAYAASNKAARLARAPAAVARTSCGSRRFATAQPRAPVLHAIVSVHALVRIMLADRAVQGLAMENASWGSTMARRGCKLKGIPLAAAYFLLAFLTISIRHETCGPDAVRLLQTLWPTANMDSGCCLLRLRPVHFLLSSYNSNIYVSTVPTQATDVESSFSSLLDDSTDYDEDEGAITEQEKEIDESLLVSWAGTVPHRMVQLLGLGAGRGRVVTSTSPPPAGANP